MSSSGGQIPVVWSVASGELPPGLELTRSGLLRGTPTNAGFYSFGLKAEDSLGNVADKPFGLTFEAPLVIDTSFIADVTVNSPINVELSGSGGTVPYEWEIIEGSLPIGISFDENGIFSGLPQSSEKVEFTVSLIDSNERKITKGLNFEIVENLELISANIPQAISGEEYLFEFSTKGGTPPYRWSLSEGLLPEGIVISSEGVISGVTNVVSNRQVSIRVTDNGGRSATVTYIFSVSVGSDRQEIAARGGTIFIDIDQNGIKYNGSTPNDGFESFLVFSSSEKVQVHFIGQQGQIPSWVLCDLNSETICSFD